MLKGGSESEVKDSYTHGFFHEGVDSYVIRASQPIELRLLPAFDTNLKSGSDEFLESTVPYRDRSLPEDYYTKSPGFSSFYYPVAGYTFYGNNKLSWLCPLTGGSTNRQGICPAADVYKYCFKNEDAALHALTVSKSKTDRAMVVRTRVFGLLNCYMKDPRTNEAGNKILIITQASLNQLKKRLSTRAGREDPIITEDFKEFLFGDITDMKTGSIAMIRETHIEDNPSLKFAGVFFSEKDGYLDGRKADVLDPKKKEVKEILRGRYNIADDESITNIRSYDEILEMIVSDGAIPYNIIERACSRYAENGIPSAPKGVVAVTPVIQEVSPPEEVQQTPVVEEDAIVETPTESNEDEAENAPQVAVEAPQASTKLDPKDEKRFWDLHKRYEENHAEMTGEDLSDYFTLRIKSGVQV